MNERFEIPARLRNTSMALMLIGIITLIAGAVVLLGSSDVFEKSRFWTSLVQDSVYFVMITTASVFIQAASSLAQGAWIVAYRRVPEAIGANVWVFGLIAAIVLLAVAFTYNVTTGDTVHNPIYTWMHPDEVEQKKNAFLNPGMFVGFTIVTLGLWAFFGRKFRSLSLAQETAPKNDTKIYWTMVKFSGIFLFIYALTQMSTTPWLWLMSIQAHWFSTMFSWYTFASAFVAGMGLILLWVVYLKNQGNLEIVNKEHVHDLGKFMFAFSIFWTYVWFDQYMLIWYGNEPEETIFFKLRQQGPYSLIFYADIIINFIMPILILMTAPSKRNYFTVTFMALVIIFGHWLDFYQMVMPNPLKDHWHIGWYEMGIFAGFVGVLIFSVSRTLAKSSLVPVNNVLLKEAVIHRS
ncbi:MAG: hypothetical protein BGO69_07150 [Bacteroidetes bacterium 46-16]|nr:MAG: hypothetical protein BGO69_07150 [Bacteroidetes bacterium 46-16]